MVSAWHTGLIVSTQTDGLVPEYFRKKSSSQCQGSIWKQEWEWKQTKNGGSAFLDWWDIDSLPAIWKTRLTFEGLLIKMILSVEKPETKVLCFRKENSHCQNYNHKFSVDLDACDLGSGLYKNENQMCQELCYLEQLRRNTWLWQGFRELWSYIASSRLELITGSKKSWSIPSLGVTKGLWT